mgnify:CR=1 FL=1
MFVYITSFFVLILFLLLGLILTIFFIQNLFMSISGFGLLQILFIIIGIYLIYKPVIYIGFLIKNKNKFNKIFDNFMKENKKAIILATTLSAIFLSLFYSNIHLNFDFFANTSLYILIFILNNLVFIANIFLLRCKLMFLTPVTELILPISEILYLFWVSAFIFKPLKQKS